MARGRRIANIMIRNRASDLVLVRPADLPSTPL